MVNGTRRDRTGIALSALAATAFGTVAIFAKFGYEAGADATALLGVRFAIAAALLWMFHVAARRPVRVGRRNLVRLLLLGALGYGIESSLFFVALQHASAAVVMLVFYSYPLLTTIGAIALGLDRFRARVAAALVLGIAGIALIFTVPGGGLTGSLYALAAAIAVTAYFLVAQVLVREVEPSAAAMWTSVGAAAAVGGSAVVTGQSFPSGAIPAAAALGVATAIAFVLMYEGISRIGSSRFAVAAMLEPVTTIVLAWIVLGDPVGVRVVLGGALVIAALPVLATERERESHGLAPEAVEI